MTDLSSSTPTEEIHILHVDDDPTFSFALPSGSYATVLLREFTKRDPLEP